MSNLKIKDNENINSQNKNVSELEDKFKDPSNPQDTFSQIEFDTKETTQWSPPVEALDFGEEVKLLDVNANANKSVKLQENNQQNNYVSIQAAKNTSPIKYSSVGSTDKPSGNKA